jgi:EAL domain-containing protein (putative c-di-GMP-specific phosphodiesterase class I)
VGLPYTFGGQGDFPMSDFDPKDVRNLSGPIKPIVTAERRSHADTVTAAAKPPITLSAALQSKWVEIWYQPKIDLKRKFLASAEAMARIRHPQFDTGSFLPEVDETSMMELARHTLLTTLADWATFEEAGFNLHFSINVPVSVLLKLPIPRLVAQNRPYSKRWPGLRLGVKADHMARDAGLAKSIATQLRVSGISFAVGDFGGGAVSLASLRDLPFAELKIDRSFVIGCGTDAANAAICQTAIDLAHRFGSVAIADGLERTADLQALIAMGCDFGQGVLIAPPMPKLRFLELLRQRMSGKPSAPAKEPLKEPAGAAPNSVGRVA